MCFYAVVCKSLGAADVELLASVAFDLVDGFSARAKLCACGQGSWCVCILVRLSWWIGRLPTCVRNLFFRQMVFHTVFTLFSMVLADMRLILRHVLWSLRWSRAVCLYMSRSMMQNSLGRYTRVCSFSVCLFSVCGDQKNLESQVPRGVAPKRD